MLSRHLSVSWRSLPGRTRIKSKKLSLSKSWPSPASCSLRWSLGAFKRSPLLLFFLFLLLLLLFLRFQKQGQVIPTQLAGSLAKAKATSHPIEKLNALTFTKRTLRFFASLRSLLFALMASTWEILYMYKCTETRSKQERQREGERKEEMQSCLNPGYLPCAALLSASLNLSALDLACPGPSVKLEVRYVAPKRTAKNPILGSGKWFKIHVFKSGPPQFPLSTFSI